MTLHVGNCKHMNVTNCYECLEEKLDIAVNALIQLNHRAAKEPVTQEFVVGVTGMAVERMEAVDAN